MTRYGSLKALIVVALGAASVGVGLTAQDAQAPAPTMSVNDGVYTASQASRGEGAYDAFCGSCHELESFTGPDFIEGWQGPLIYLFDDIRTTMPEDNPGGLPPQRYADVIAFLLKQNGYPAGTTELAGNQAAMEAVMLEPAAAPPPAR